MKICMFCGHHGTPKTVRPLLTAEIERQITDCGIEEFWVGNYDAFDRMARSEVSRAKARHTKVCLCLLFPYFPKEGNALDTQGVDHVIFPQGMECVPLRLAINRLNRYMVRHTDAVVAYVDHISAGAYRTLEMAKKKRNMQITNLADRFMR